MASSRRNHNALSATEARAITARPRLFLSLSLSFALSPIPSLFNKFCRRTDPVTSMEIQPWHVFRLNYLGNGPPPVLISFFFFFSSAKGWSFCWLPFSLLPSLPFSFFFFLLLFRGPMKLTVTGIKLGAFFCCILPPRKFRGFTAEKFQPTLRRSFANASF